MSKAGKNKLAEYFWTDSALAIGGGYIRSGLILLGSFAYDSTFNVFLTFVT